MLDQHYPFTLPPLPCAYNALEPYIDTETMRIHHDIMFKKYVDNLNMILKDNPIYQDWSLHNLLAYSSDFEDLMETALKNNGGGVMNHYMYFDGMTPNKTEPSQNLSFVVSLPPELSDVLSEVFACELLSDVSGSDSGGVHAGSLTEELFPFPPKNFISGEATEYPTKTNAPSITTKRTPSNIFLPVLLRFLYRFLLERFTLNPFFLLISVSPF